MADSFPIQPDFPVDFFARPAPDVARDLVGARLAIAKADGRQSAGLITETEAYRRDDPASHSFRGPTPRNGAMFGPAGRAYVYLCYGIHWCLNVVCLPGEAVLLRAMEPVDGMDLMAARRGLTSPGLLATGPGRLAQALAVDRSHDGQPFGTAHMSLSPAFSPEIITGPRIGIRRAIDLPWRFGWAGSAFLSRPFPQ
ncbi:DNA-3-methyladenine glycosylase [Gemmobacter serpentinus]|uniref:DNA-3-methyladenine glycosylase n=1 Tax=Gemmobacter serpentinus TaxID=2652247 RepID=UPI00124F5FE6|nr:DNA-3-methyladenine glycosylase [Gemmobacter serpentinus]